jgi:hypothetical protein
MINNEPLGDSFRRAPAMVCFMPTQSAFDRVRTGDYFLGSSADHSAWELWSWRPSIAAIRLEQFDPTEDRMGLTRASSNKSYTFVGKASTMVFNPWAYDGEALRSLLDDLTASDHAAIAARWHNKVEWPLRGPSGASLCPPVELQTTWLMPPDTATCLPPDHPDVSIPDVVLETYLGGSRQGWVWAARVVSTGRIVAVKILAGDYVENAGLAAREAIICAKLRHPNIIRVFHVQPAGSHWVIIMELVQGEDLRRLRYSTTDRQFFGQLADAVRTTSESHVVHRDLKPANIVLRFGSLSPVIVDFGLAVDLETPEWDREGIAGTPLFMAPEAIAGQSPNPSWDAYSLGITAADIILVNQASIPYRSSSVSEILDAKTSGSFDRAFKETVHEIRNKTLRDWCLELTDSGSSVRVNAVCRASKWLRVGPRA